MAQLKADGGALQLPVAELLQGAAVEDIQPVIAPDGEAQLPCHGQMAQIACRRAAAALGFGFFQQCAQSISLAVPPDPGDGDAEFGFTVQIGDNVKFTDALSGEVDDGGSQLHQLPGELTAAVEG